MVSLSARGRILSLMALRRAFAVASAGLSLTALVALACGGAYEGADPPEELPSADDAGRVDSDTASTTTDAGIVDVDAARAADAGPSWLLYAYFEQAQRWGDPLPLEQYFGNGANAPPRRDLRAMTWMAPLGQLLIVDASGMLYIRKGAAWLTPRPLKDVFTTLGDVVPNAVFYVPQIDGGTASVGLTFTAANRAFLFEYAAGGGALPTGTPVTLTDKPGEPPSGSQVARWNFEVYDTSKFGTAAWAAITSAFPNDEVWQMDGAGAFQKWVGAQYPLFAKPQAPPRGRVREAFRSDGDHIVYMVVEP
jgi:hypothetical protein